MEGFFRILSIGHVELRKEDKRRMMGKTHITVGIATALLFATSDNNMTMVIAALAGGSLGGVAADVDILDRDYTHDATRGQKMAVGLTAVSLGIDKIVGTGILDAILEDPVIAITGAVMYAVLMAIGYHADHRAITHSLLYMVLCTIAISLISVPIAVFYFIGYASHLIIDLFNKKGIQLFFPLKIKPCLHLLYASGIGNTIFMFAGLGASVLLLIGYFIPK